MLLLFHLLSDHMIIILLICSVIDYTVYTACPTPSHIFTYSIVTTKAVSTVLRSNESDNESENQMDSVILTPSYTH